MNSTKMSSVVLNPNNLKSDLCTKKNENVSDSENDTDLTIEKGTHNWERFQTNQNNGNKLVFAPNICEPNIFDPNNDSNINIKHITVENSSNTMFGNKTIYKAPVTINQFSNEISYKKNKNKWKCTNKFIFGALVAAIVILAIVLTLILVLSPSDEDFQLRIVPREDWRAKPPKNITNLELPSIRVIIAHTVTANCFDQSDCGNVLRMIQNYHMETVGCDDIGYNFLVGGDGVVYVGRGWDVRGEHTYGFNARSVGIAFIGDFSHEPPPKKQLLAAQAIIEEGVKMEKLIENYKLFGQRQLLETASPGDELYKIILKWKHWSTVE